MIEQGGAWTKDDWPGPAPPVSITMSESESIPAFTTLAAKLNALREFFNCSVHDTLVIVGKGGSGKTCAINQAIRVAPHPPLTVYHEFGYDPCSIPGKGEEPKTIHCLIDAANLESIVCGYRTRSRDRVQVIEFQRGTEPAL